MKLKPLALGITIGIFWGVSVFLTTVLCHYTGYGKLFLEALPQSLYPGYSITLRGSFAGLVYGFVDGFVSGAIVGWIYNKVAGNSAEKS
ncbi:MAG: bacteriophage holin [Thermodesulfovibrionia bacterium]|nr:bacteriophage holin [Thermodesulfovibrionia bacterium]MCK5287323.1 bacteriophage holin [Thermodesulfovibrionia bacterium]